MLLTAFQPHFNGPSFNAHRSILSINKSSLEAIHVSEIADGTAVIWGLGEFLLESESHISIDQINSATA